MPDEVQRVLKDLGRRAKRFPTQRTNRVVFVLLTGCGLRRTEAGRLQLGDLRLTGPRPALRLRAATTKGRNGKKRSRVVPLWWSADTLAVLTDWVRQRHADGAQPHDPLLVSLTGRPLLGGEIARRWRTSLKCLGADRVMELPSHAGRRTFASLAYAAGRSALEIKEALGHADLATTSRAYLYALESKDAKDILAF